MTFWMKMKFIAECLFFLTLGVLIIPVFIFAMFTYVTDSPDRAYPSFMPFGLEYPFEKPFIEQVEELAKATHNATPPPPMASNGAYGNCLPVAHKIVEELRSQKRIAVIVVTHPRPEKPWYHAVVLFDSDNNGTLDSVIDNGFSTGFKVQPKSDLDSGKFGKVYGVCITDDPQSMACRISPLP